MFYIVLIAAVILIYWLVTSMKSDRPKRNDFSEKIKIDRQIEEMRLKAVRESDIEVYGLEEDSYEDEEEEDEKYLEKLSKNWAPGEPYLLIIDLETSGLRKYRHADPANLSNWPRIVQIAYQVFDVNFQELDRISVIFKQPRPLPPDSIDIHGITDQMCKEKGVKPEPILKKLFEYSQQAKYFVAHNADFDYGVLEANLRRFKISDDFRMEQICTMVASRKLKGFKPVDRNGKKKNATLGELHQFLFREEPEGLHHAEVDMLAASRCFFELKEKGIVL